MKIGEKDIGETLIALMSAYYVRGGEEYAVRETNKMLVSIACFLTTVVGHEKAAEHLQVVADQVFEIGMKQKWDRTSAS